MIEHLTHNQVEEYCRRQLHRAELLSVSDHLDECEGCRRQIESALNGNAAFFALRSGIFDEDISSSRLVRQHPTEEQMTGYVDGNLSRDDLQTIGDHLTLCEPCALVEEDLRSFRDQVVTSLDREYHPGSALPSATEGWWQRAIASLRSFFGSGPRLAFAGAMAILLLVLVGWLAFQTQPRQEEPPRMTEAPTPPPPPAPAPQPSAVPLVAQLRDGVGELTLDQEGKLSGASDLPPAYQNMLKEALTNPRIETSSNLKGLSRPGSTLMSGDKPGSDFSVSEPIGSVLVTDRPAFRWSALEGATSYVVEVYDASFNLVASSPQVTNRLWTAPKLPRGRVYSWQVQATRDGQEITSPRPPAPQARFRILDGAKANELAKARQAYGSSHLTLGLLYAEAGLIPEAEKELRALLRANPYSEIARKLLRQVQAQRR
ncbi:MAG TPA: hypothetical protein VG778_02905 [Blastocatellia bacterium]|nr:hypothetical protein [Blastocatellia bacterium]